MNMLENIRIVLVEPIFGGNIGSVCRAMNNNGITDLAIVNPRSTTDWDDARKLACNAKAQLDARKEYATLADAVADCTVVAATSARTGFYRDTAYSPRAFAPIALESAVRASVRDAFSRRAGSCAARLHVSQGPDLLSSPGVRSTQHPCRKFDAAARGRGDGSL